MRVDDLRHGIERGATLLVPTQRAARAWRKRLADITPAPAILPWAAWTAAQWQTLLLHGHDDRLLLNPVQNLDLWSQILHADQPETLRPVRSLVRLCTAAQHLLHTHGGTARQLRFHGDPGTDVATFADWFRSYTARCHTERLLPASALDDALSTHVATGNLPVASPLILLGFDRLTPAQHHLLSTIDAAAGTPTLTVDLHGQAGSHTVLLQCADSTHEAEALVENLRIWLDAPSPNAPAEPSHDAAVLVVLPDAEGSRATLDRTLRTAFPGRPVWEFAAGLPLATLPLTADALHLLRWVIAPAPSATVSRLLQSPFLHLRIDRERAGELDAETLRDSRRLRPEWTVAALAHRVSTREPELAEALHALESTAARQLRGHHLYGDWADRIRTVLQAAGWPGTRDRTTLEYQLVDRWNELLDTLATLDCFDRTVPFSTFLADLEAAAADTLFAAENTGAPIQIVSPAEAAGTTAAHLWFAHATEKLWNARRIASPLLPWQLQADCAMPGTDSTHDRTDHQRTTLRLLGSAPHVTVSYAAMDADGDLRPAAIFDEVPGLDRQSAAASALPAEAPALEAFTDDLPLPPLPEGTVHGGVSVLKDQAACAFRAFAERRLFSSQPDTATLGLDPRQRGELLHYVLQLFWSDVQTQARLLDLQAAGTLAATLQRHIDTALAAPASTDPWNSAYLELQRKRLHRLLMKWFELEAKRPPFRVAYTEHDVPNVQVGPLRFNLRVDRIDEIVRDGQPTLALIDYKTGSTSAAGWQGPRPDEPQLPLYAAHASLQNVGAIAFATVRPGDKHLGLRALPATTELLFPGKLDKKPEDFDRQMEVWYTTMVRLAEEFATGDTRVGPKQFPGTCTFCGQRMLCRLNPELLQQLGNDEDDAPAESPE